MSSMDSLFVIVYINVTHFIFAFAFCCIAPSDPADLKPNWIPKADIPATVPKLAPEYIHRHRLMKQAVNSLLGSTGADSDPSEEPIVSSSLPEITYLTDHRVKGFR